jgi:hypothetical protein
MVIMSCLILTYWPYRHLRRVVMTWQGAPLSQPAANAAWELVVELRTGFPEISTAFAAGDRAKARHCLDRFPAKAIKAAAWLGDSWPTLADDIDRAVAALKAEPGDEAAWRELTEIASELEDAIGAGPVWLSGPEA